MINKPAGYYGFYTLGITSYIKETYNLDDFCFSGASAGAWNSLFSVYKKNSLQLVDDLLNSVDKLDDPSLYQIQKCLKNQILANTKIEDYDVDKLYIGVTSVKQKRFICDIYSNFTSLDDVIDCCISSSHIPLVTGGLFNKYRGLFTFDGGLTYNNHPSINHLDPFFEINADIWNNAPIINSDSNFITKFIPTAFRGALFPVIKEISFRKLYEAGWRDSKNNKRFLDKIFID